MESLPASKDLDLKRSSAPGTIARLIPDYLTTLRLRKLRIDECLWASPVVVQNILCSMPSLEVLIADCVLDIAIQEDPRPWVCTGLRELTTEFVFRCGSEGDTLILERLATMDRLESLTVQQGNWSRLRSWTEYSDWRYTDIESMPLSLERGLDQLRALRELRSLRVKDRVTRWGKDEAQWALENWVHLIRLDIAVDQEAGVLLQHRLVPIQISFFED